jgi:hypothetical protein
MMYMTVYSIAPENFEAVKKRFFEENEPLEGVKRVGRWSEFGTSKGFDLFETDDPVAMSKLGFYWADLVDMKIVPVVEDEVVAKALRG